MSTETKRVFELGGRIYHPETEQFGIIITIEVIGTQLDLQWLTIKLEDGQTIQLRPAEVYLSGNETREATLRSIPKEADHDEEEDQC